jgi:hypothetical protein
MFAARLRSLVLVFACGLASLAMPAAQAVEVQAGPIFNNMDAQGKCPRVCQQNGNSRWNGQWHTITGTATSVCDCEGGMSPVSPKGNSQWAEAGPLFNNMDGRRRNRAGCRSAVARARAWPRRTAPALPAVREAAAPVQDARCSAPPASVHPVRKEARGMTSSTTATAVA